VSINIYNTASKKIEPIVPLQKGVIKMYSCGPTVYDYTHIGHARTYVLTDIFRRVLEFMGYKVIQVMNITDVGHLTTDDDLGEDKILKALRKQKQKSGNKDITVYDIVDFYTKDFMQVLKELNILPATYMPKATEHVDDMIKLIERLFEKGYAYKTDKAIYFDVKKFKDYTKLFKQALDEKIVGAREGVNVDKGKKHPADFRLWQLDQPNHILQWNTPWGKGFPGWHIECSAMSMHYLGESFDIHTGGEDHIFPHHTNEIAQSEAATGKEFSKYWVHFYHLMSDGKKMSKSLGNYYRLKDLEEKGFLPEHVRYLFLGTHYRKRLNFTLESLKSASRAYQKMVEIYQIVRSLLLWQFVLDTNNLEQGYKIFDKFVTGLFGDSSKVVTKDQFIEYASDLGVKEEFSKILDEFVTLVTNDLKIPEALALVWSVLKDPKADYRVKFLVFGLVFNVFGLKLKPKKVPFEDLIKDNIDLAKQYVDLTLDLREFKAKKEWSKADSVKQEILGLWNNKNIRLIDTMYLNKLSVVIYG